MDEKPVFLATIPVNYHASKKNSKDVYFNPKTGKRFVGSNHRVKKAEDLLLLQLRQRAIDLRITEPFTGRMRGLFYFGFPPDKFYTRDLTESQLMGDCSNLVQIVEDCLQKAGIISNDFWLAPITVDRICTEAHSVRIELYSYDAKLPQLDLWTSLKD